VGVFFLDSSALVKRYVQEPGTSWIRALTRRGTFDEIYLSRITAVELTSAVARRRRRGTLSAARTAAILSRFSRHLTSRYVAVEITPTLVRAAMNLANTHELRAYDAVQLAAAIGLNTESIHAGSNGITLVSADIELNKAAQVEGLVVEDTSAYP
jgi:uncharacterized protein